MTWEKKTLIRFIPIYLTFPEPFRVIRVRVSPPESGIVIKSQPETMRASQSHSVSIANGPND
jgi:hypothetical protein